MKTLNSNQLYSILKVTLCHILLVVEGLGKFVHCLKIVTSCSWQRGWVSIYIDLYLLIFSHASVGKTNCQIKKCMLSLISPLHDIEIPHCCSNSVDFLQLFFIFFPSGESAFRTMSIPFGWAKHPMMLRITDLDKSIPITLVYGSRSWIDSNTGQNVKYLRPDSYVDVQVFLSPLFFSLSPVSMMH